MTAKKKVLLIEPNYANKFPPVGLMKIATYYRNRGDWDVFFYKGDLRLFVIERITDQLIDAMYEIDPLDVDWYQYRHLLFDYIKTRKKDFLQKLPVDESPAAIMLWGLIEDAKDKYWKKRWESEPEFDRVGVTTLFTFYWDITVKTILFAKKLVKDPKNLHVGGVLASLQPDELEAATGIRPHVGILRPGDLDPDDHQDIDSLELDYSILDEIDYKYPMSSAYYRYTTRGCIRNCKFCAVPILEPEYQSYIPLKERIDRINDLYGEQRDLLLMDNNVLASDDFPKIIQEIIDCGFKKGAVFKEPNQLEIAIRNLKNGVNDRAYRKKAFRLIREYYAKLNGDDSFAVSKILEKYHMEDERSAKKENLIAAYEELKDGYASSLKRLLGKKRFIDFNQGMDARLFNEENVKLLSQIAIKPLRIAFDYIHMQKQYDKAIRLCVSAGMKDFSNYLLYNFNDKPDDLYLRLKFNVELCEELDVSIYSFPMRYHPIRKMPDMDQDYSHNRNYIGIFWNKKYIRAVQAILNSTKGKIGRSITFFQKAFGRDINEYRRLLEMPESMIIYRFFYEWLGTDEGKDAAIQVTGTDELCQQSTDAWWDAYCDCHEALEKEEWDCVVAYIHNNDFSSIPDTFQKPEVARLLKYYKNGNKNDAISSGTPLYKLKQIYEKNPIQESKRINRKLLM